MGRGHTDGPNKTRGGKICRPRGHWTDPVSSHAGDCITIAKSCQVFLMLFSKKVFSSGNSRPKLLQRRGAETQRGKPQPRKLNRSTHPTRRGADHGRNKDSRDEKDQRDENIGLHNMLIWNRL
jgi:hypothetical protein